MNSSPAILLSCGEASGDVYLARIAQALHERRPDLRLVGVPGELGRRAGVEPWARAEDLSVMGFAEVVRHIPRLMRLAGALARRAEEEGVVLFLPVDYPGFHVRVAARMQKRGIHTLDFIPPKTWSWGAWRQRGLRRSVDRCAVIFPFEEEHYRRAGIDARFVGHPLVDLHGPVLDEPEPGREGLLLVPGSRRQELARLVEPLAEAVRILRARLGDDMVVSVSRAPGVQREWLGPLADPAMRIQLVEGTLISQLGRSRAAVVCSGTATMEAALARTPHVIVYRTGSLSYFLARRVALVEHIGMANIVLGRRVFPELLQGDLTARGIADQVGPLFLDPRGEPARAQNEAFAELGSLLGPPGCFDRVADLALSMIEDR